MVRAPFYDKGLKKGAWSREEDERLRAYIQRHGHANWRLLPKIAGLARCGKSCRLRWLNYLRPNLKHGNYTQEEEEIIIKLHHQFGNKWSLIAEKLPGRSDNEVKNYWHSHLKKCSKGYESTISELESKPTDNLEENTTHQFVGPESPVSSTVVDDFPHILESSILMSTKTSERDNYSPTSSFAESTLKRDNFAPSVKLLEEFNDNFWTEPFIVEDTYTTYNEICSSEDTSLLISSFYDDVYLFQNLEDFA